VPAARPVALTIAGSDPSGGAGIQADLKTFHQFGVYGEAAITLITVQNTIGVDRVECLPPDLVAQQIRAVLEDIPPQAIKLGALGNAAIIEAVAASLYGFKAPLVIDPVMVGKHGAALLNADAIDIFKRLLLPRAFLITPNLMEAAALTGINVETEEQMAAAAAALVALGAHAALIKGGHLAGTRADDLLLDGSPHVLAQARIETRHTHGTGCTYAAAIAAELARGTDLRAAVECAKRFVTDAIRTAPHLGQGAGPLNHFARTPFGD
jgi:hydroxymethylpyrimidine/phosphomethylpyrimidine kinase